MRRHRAGRHIIRRVLHRRKGKDLFAQGKHDDPARVLSRGSPDPHAAGQDALNLAPPFVDALILIVMRHIAVGRLICQRAYRPGPEGLAFSENHLGIAVRPALVFSGEIQVNIRLLVALKAQERLKRDIKSILFKRFAAHRAEPVRHIAAGHAGKLPHLLGIKVIEMAVWAVVMGA